MYNFLLPHQDWVYISDKTITAVKEYHNSDKRLDFRGMPEREINEYMESWLAALPATALAEFYDDAMRSNSFIRDHILETFTDQISKGETEITLMRNAFQRPSNDSSKPYSWADKVVDAVNEVIEMEARDAA